MITKFPHIDHVNGWLSPQALSFTSYYTHTFLSGAGFDSLEIGVHRGKYFIALENLTPRDNAAVAIDLFDMQEKNIDNSGKGDLAIFEAHVKEFCSNPDRVRAISADSLDLSAAELGANAYGLISVDGGHTAEHTIADLEKADVLMSTDGLVILDDILNQDWTGVVTGAVHFFSAPRGRRLAPFALGFNKLFCCHFSKVGLVKEQLEADQETLAKLNISLRKTTEFAGYPVFSLRGA